MENYQYVEKINKLRKEKNAVILAHNYQRSEIQDIADFSGDSLELSIKAAQVKEKIIVFCGVLFMAETAKTLSPDKIVLLPDENAGCPMADMVNAEQVRKLKNENPNAKVLCYVNSSIQVKAQADLCCTSSNAAKIVEYAFDKNQEIIFVPDKWLARVVAEKTGRKFIVWDGFCPTHSRILPENIIELKKQYPHAITMVHPECTKEVCDTSDEILSTGQMSMFVQKSNAEIFIIGTEEGMLHRLQKENPLKKFILASQNATCPNMKKITLKKLADSLETLSPEIILDTQIIKKAENSIRKMIDISKKIM
ncbi:MAG: quinolinate synthase NadA [Chitinispirillales bacterium]|jgi:quinolinate synthase|nr:quinolinate synthase NadA [Chitinispirillales bacterium]